uniref:F-box domain-containing protein n=1 Tax=Leersia perrieri TaxID=77586 RepID=A0A0D9V2I9_9ORYZ
MSGAEPQDLARPAREVRRGEAEAETGTETNRTQPTKQSTARSDRLPCTFRFGSESHWKASTREKEKKNPAFHQRKFPLAAAAARRSIVEVSVSSGLRRTDRPPPARSIPISGLTYTAYHFAESGRLGVNFGGDMLRDGKRRRTAPSGEGAVPTMNPVAPSTKRRKCVPSSSWPGAMLPDELLTEVFLRVPMKSILPCQAACRSWAAILSSEEFRQLYTARTEEMSLTPKLLYVSPTANFNSTAVYLCSPSKPTDDLLFTLDDVCGDSVAVAPTPCHGLTLLYDAVAAAYWVFNAATQAVTRLPPCQEVILATAGLGFDAKTKDYKVVRLFQGKLHEKQSFKCEIYTLGGDEGDHWRPAAGGVPFRFCRWIRSPRFEVSGVHLVELDDQLCIVRDLRDRSAAVCMLEVWKLKDFNSGDWSLDHRIDLTGQLPRDLLEPQIVKVIGSFGSCGSSKKIIIATSKHKVCAYDPVSGTLETIISILETCTSYQNEKSDIRFSFFKECLTPVRRTREEIALSTPLAKATEKILLRLPAESILKFKLVCKQWFGLIKSDRFVRAYFVNKNMDKRPKIMLVVCSKPCHGLNLVSIEEKDYLFNPCTGYHRIYHNRHKKRLQLQLQPLWKVPIGCCEQEDNPFAVDSKNVGLAFSQVIQDHVVVAIFYDWRDYKSRGYYIRCVLFCCGSGYSQHLPEPPLPVNDMPPASLDGVLYWMSEPRLGWTYERAIVSFDVTAKIFNVIPCPSCIAMWDSKSRCHAFVVELQGMLCAVLSNSVADELDIWKWNHGLWSRAYTINLKLWPDYSLATNFVVPLAVDPTDGRVLLNTGRKLGLYNPFEQAIEILFTLDQASVVTSKVQRRHPRVHRKCITRCEDVPSKSSPWKLSMALCENFASPSSASSGKELNCVNPIMPVVPMLYEESLAYYPQVARARGFLT